jgi:predicted DNA binding CopG/RHH family protein
MRKKIAAFKNDAEAERFVTKSDTTKYDLSGGKAGRLEFAHKDGQLNMHHSAVLVKAVKARAKERGIPYTRFVRETLERFLARRA